MLHYLNPNLTLEQCRQVDAVKAANRATALKELRENAEKLPPELRSQYMATVMPIVAMLLF